ncbi:hypothetical protein BD779DRAFT_1454541, partial [Infundibulicybe gibba]
TLVSCVQAWYYSVHQKDSWPTRCLVGTVILFDTVHQILISHTVYTYLIKNYGNVEQLNTLIWYVLIESYLSLRTCFIQLTSSCSFLTMRIWRLSDRNIWITSVMVLSVLGEFGMSMAHGKVAGSSNSTYLTDVIRCLSIMVNVLAATSDILIVAMLCILLHQARTGSPSSDTMINKLILFAVNTGFLTSLCAVASLVSILVAGGTFLYIGFFFCIGRLYTNSLLANLNARKMIRCAGGMNTSNNDSVSLRDFPGTVHSGVCMPSVVMM